MLIFLASSRLLTNPSEPGTTGTPAFFIVALALDLFPISSIISLDGPINLIPISLHILAKELLSDKKPYPGWILSAPVWQAASIKFFTFK